MAHITKTDTLPEDVRAAGYTLPEPIIGGPVFVIKNVTVDFSQVTLKLAAALAPMGILNYTPPMSAQQIEEKVTISTTKK